jgi:hypothetical protein
MKQAFTNGCGRSFSVDRFSCNLLFYKEVTITNALRSQFDYEGYEKLPEECPRSGIRVIEGRGI